MAHQNDHVWGIILAAGDGVRLKPYIQSRFNSDCPKQFCVFTGTRSMLAHTIARVTRYIPIERTVVTITEAHGVYARKDLEHVDNRNIITQPSNKETSASILLPLLHIMRRDPDAIVVIFPSDHYIREEERFMEYVRAGTEFVEHHSKYLLLLGIESESLLQDYGWIETSMKIADIRGSEILRVKRFMEKPDAKKAFTVQRNRTLCNTMVFISLASSMLRKFRLMTPAVFHAFKKIDEAISSPHEEEIVHEVYSVLTPVDFSKAILGHDPRGLAVIRIQDVYWNDWGDETRIRTDLERMKK
ncbi:MAG TPA: sugar phosphate nucleotidyltransferase [Bacteroidota bacterium]|nr:sugar phosphate nucleotidyltransferase [Bacteroidota bacterium]